MAGTSSTELWVDPGEHLSINGQGGSYYLVNPQSTSRVELRLAGAPRFHVDEQGNAYFSGDVGVRTSSPPRGMLAIHDETNDRSDHLYLSSSGDQNNGYRIGRQPDGRLEFQGYQGTHSGFRFILPTGTALTVDPNGNVGIGTPSPGAKLDVAGRVQANATDPLAYQFLNEVKTEGLVIDTQNRSVRPATDNAYILGAGAQRWQSLHIGTGDSSFAGNVGIGTPSPGAKLEVVGDIKASGNITVGAAGDMAVTSGRKLFLDGLGGTRYIANDPSQDHIDVGGPFQPEPAADLGLSIDRDGTISTNGNLRILRSGVHGNPTLYYLGRQGFHYNPPPPPPAPQDPVPDVPLHTNYFFWQNRWNKEGYWWGGWNTFRHPETVKGSPIPTPDVAWGYGYYPFRNWAKNYLFESSGVVVSKQYVAVPTVYFQAPLHRDLVTGNFIKPDGYDSNDHPFIWQPTPEQEPPGTPLTIQDIPMTPPAGAPGTDPDGPITINVQSTTGFAENDEVLLTNSTGSRREINEILSIDSANNRITLKRGSVGFTLAEGTRVKRVLELGGVQPDTTSSGLAVFVRRNGDDLILQDVLNSGGIRLSRFLTGSVDKRKIDRGETSATYTMGPNSTADLGFINLSAGFSFTSDATYVVLLTPSNVLNSWGVSLAVDYREGPPNNRFRVLARNDHPTLSAEFYVQWMAIGT